LLVVGFFKNLKSPKSILAICSLFAAMGSGGRARMRNGFNDRALADGRTTMKHFMLSIALSALMVVAVSATTQAAYYHHRHHHYWHGGSGSYWNYYRTNWPGRGNNEESTR
jgi:hypothetical protein